MKTSDIKRIIVSRTDSIGDVILTLPLCVWIKKQFPEATLVFLARGYTIPVVSCFLPVDEILDWDLLSNLPSAEKNDRIKSDCIIHVFPNSEIASLAKKAKIPIRIGTSHRTFHFLTCNFKVNFSRKNSLLHEAQLNFELARPLGLKVIPSLEELMDQRPNFLVPVNTFPNPIAKIELSKAIVLHPKSQGSALEWPIEKYLELANELVKSGKVVLITGTEAEGLLIRERFTFSPQLIDVTGQLSLSQMISLLSEVKVAVACSTGPIHIKSIIGGNAIALFATRRPIHPGRWRPLGLKSTVMVFDENCPGCKKSKSCRCLENISVANVLNFINEIR